MGQPRYRAVPGIIPHDEKLAHRRWAPAKADFQATISRQDTQPEMPLGENATILRYSSPSRNPRTLTTVFRKGVRQVERCLLADAPEPNNLQFQNPVWRAHRLSLESLRSLTVRTLRDHFTSIVDRYADVTPLRLQNRQDFPTHVEEFLSRRTGH